MTAVAVIHYAKTDLGGNALSDDSNDNNSNNSDSEEYCSNEDDADDYWKASCNIIVDLIYIFEQ